MVSLPYARMAGSSSACISVVPARNHSRADSATGGGSASTTR